MKRPVIIVIVLALLAGGGYFISQKMKPADGGADQFQYKLAKADTGEVKKTVSSSGVLQAWRIVDIKSRAGGQVLKMSVDVGSEVKKGQVITSIDPSDTMLTFSTARADLDSARARESQSDRTYLLQTQQTRISIANAEASLQSARANLAAVQARYRTAVAQSGAQPALTKASIQNARASYDQAVKQRAQLDSTNIQNKASAKAAYDQAMANRNNASINMKRQEALLPKGFVAQSAVDTASANLQVAEATVLNTKARLDNIDSELQANMEAADARVAQTRAALASAQANSIDILNRVNSAAESKASMMQAQAQVMQAQRALEQAKANAANDAIRRFDVASAQATIARSKASLVNAQTVLDQTTVRSPADGIILKKYVDEGTIIQSGQSGFSGGTSIVQLGDISRMYVDVTVDETDIANVDVGQKVDVNSEAYPGVPFEGTVSRVDPQATVEQNVTTIHVRVEIDNSSPTFRLLKPGMNCTCEFVVGKRDSVVRVPSEAVKEDDQGKYVEVATGGKQAPPDAKTGAIDKDALVGIVKKRVTVETGLEGNETVEVTKGIKANDQVVIQTIEPTPTASAPTSSPFGGNNNRGGGFSGGRR